MGLNTAMLWSAFFSGDKGEEPNKGQLIDYYEKAGPDYETWSTDFNMHFGYYEQGMNPFNRESMLRKMNEVVLKALNIDPEKPRTLMDMGCGLGATLRQASFTYSRLSCIGATIVPWQKQKANQLNDQAPETSHIRVLLEDYTATSLPSDSVDHVLAIESSCYGSGAGKRDLLREIHRILKPGGTFVIADGFLKTNQRLKGLLGAAYRQLCHSWALTELGAIDEVQRELRSLRFSKVNARNISWRVAPSVAHVPHTVFKFLIRQMLFSPTSMNKERWDNLKSPLLTMFLGLHQAHFGYYLVTGKK